MFYHSNHIFLNLDGLTSKRIEIILIRYLVILNYLDACTKQGYGYTVLDKGKPIVCFGIVPQWPGVAELWLIPDKNLIQKWRLKFHKGSLKFMELVLMS